MNIALDAMGGDFAPQTTVEGALLASKTLQEGSSIVLIGHESKVMPLLEAQGTIPANIKFVHAEQVVEMAEHPTKALANKPLSSISVGYKMLKNREVDAFCSAGNTGAMLVGAIFSVKVVPKVLRPSIISHVPKLSGGGYGIILDVGANTDCKPEILQQFGELGSIYCQYVFGIDKPKVALLNLGEEEQKGNLHTQAAHQLMKNNAHINFVGNIEGRDLFTDQADVIVCDGFVGNIVIKMAESYYEILKHKNISDEFFENFNFERIGGSPVLGIQGNVVIAHGVSNALAIESALLLAERMAKADIHTHIQQAIS